ncbi:MAG: hypothetical protein QW385_07550 [Thermoproteota archaeon]
MVVANTRDLRKIREEAESLSEEFGKSLAYLEAKDVGKSLGPAGSVKHDNKQA